MPASPKPRPVSSATAATGRTRLVRGGGSGLTPAHAIPARPAPVIALAGLLHGLARRLGRPDAREPGAVNHVSLGAHCHMAEVLKRTGLRGWSGPFDWIFSGPGMVRDCLADDFAALLDRAQYESTPLDARPAPHQSSCRHRLYAERHAIPFVFNHHDPATSEADYRFLAEGVRRLRTALADGGARNRFYLLATLPPDAGVVTDLCDRLATFGARNHLSLIEAMPGADAPGVVACPAPRPNLTWVRLATRSASTGVRFADPADDRLLEAAVRDLAAAPDAARPD